MESEPVILTDQSSAHLRVATLNQPRRLNVISSDVVASMADILQNWENDPDVEAIVIKGNGRAFSAGGDLKMFYQGQNIPNSCVEVVYRMYWLCYHIHTYNKTHIALAHGIAMGGGAAFVVPMKFSVVTDNTVFATPEAAVGFHTDCGFSYILSRLPSHLGEFLALTGCRLSGAEMVSTGLATHFVPSEKLPELEARLLALNSGEESAVKSVIEEFSAVSPPVGEKSILNKKAVIAECFSKESVEAILASFEGKASEEGNEWAGTYLKALKRSSPTALKITLKSIRDARDQTLGECLKKEFTITMNILNCVVSPDVYEGIRALTVDKDNAPKWDPPRVEDVDGEKIGKVFEAFEETLELKIPKDDESRWSGKFEESGYAGLVSTPNSKKDV